MIHPSRRLADPWWQRALDLLLPPRCVGCGRRGHDVCPDCLAGLRPLGPATCPRCSLPSRAGRLCRRCQHGGHSLRAVRAYYPYEGVVRAAILALKYRSRTRLAPFLASMMAAALEARPVSADLLAPVPLGPARLRSRGFNQAGLLAQHLSGLIGVPIEPAALVRARETAAQTALAARERQRNVAGAFVAPSPLLIRGKRVLLVDDVCTTGATLEACARALEQAGAAGVWAVVAAREA